MGWQPGAEPGPDEESGPEPTRDARLAGFARGGEWDSRAPSAALAAALEGVAGPEWRCPGAERDELFGLLRRCAALESWAAAGKMGLLRALMREEDLLLPGRGRHGDLPDSWSRSLTHEVALALAMPPQSAERLMWQAWDLEALLPGIGGLLADGTLTSAKARVVGEALEPLNEEDMARAEAMILTRLAGKTYGQVEKLAVQAAIAVDPESAAKRREDAERNRAKVSLRRASSGAVNLSGYDLPTDEALAAHAQVCARALVYRDCGVFSDVRMDQLRAQAYVDILNGITADARIAAGQPDTGLCAPADDNPPEADPPDDDPPAGPPDDGPPDDGPPDDGPPDDGPPDDGPPDDGPPDDGAPGDGRFDDSPPGAEPRDDGPPEASPSGLSGGHPDDDGSGHGDGSDATPAPRPADLVFPLATLLGRAWRPGEGHGLGPLDPDLCRCLAATAANSPYSTLCVTVTDAHGYAIGHGCGRPARRARDPGQPSRTGNSPPGVLVALAARVNLTINSTLLTTLAAQPGTAPPNKPGSWSFTRSEEHGPPDGYGTWELVLPDGRTLIVALEPVPTFDCDHRRESHAYQPNDALRHLVQVRDYECTFPTCSRHARESDFEHAIPYDRGGKTCGCNAGARSRRCHQVKQSPGWEVTQPRPGWHQWRTPSGRVYQQEPKRYPV